MRKPSEILSSALASFEDGEKWIQGSLWRNKYDEACLPKDAETFCSIGAIRRDMVLHGETDSNGWPNTTLGNLTYNGIMSAMTTSGGGREIAYKNDSAFSFSVVKEMFCNGIKRALEEEEKNDKQS